MQPATRGARSIAATGVIMLTLLLLMVVPVAAQNTAQNLGQTAQSPLQTPSPTAQVVVASDPEVRVKDITRVQGVRDNQLVGLGLVVGLKGTGDGTGSQANVEMVSNMLQQFGITVDTEHLRLRNSAAVMVTATLPAFAREGDNLDATVASMGDARSLEGGLLLQTPLQGADGQVYAVAQGLVSVGGQSGSNGFSSRTHSLTSRVIGGAIVEQEVPNTFLQGNQLTLVLQSPDFTTASRIAEVINFAMASSVATAIDPNAVEVQVPANYQQAPTDFLAAIEELPVKPDAPARVVINERTGTVVIGGKVRVAPVAVAHGELSVKIGDTANSAQWTWPPNSTKEQSTVLDGTSVEAVVEGLNSIGASPKDIVSLLQAIKAAGALYGELVVI